MRRWLLLERKEAGENFFKARVFLCRQVEKSIKT